MIKKLSDKTWCQYLCALLLPLLLLAAAFAALGITPFGDNTMLFADANAQYVQYFSYTQRLLHGQESLLYSFGKDLGGNMLNQITWYLFNPVYLLFYFGGVETLPTTYSLVCMLTTSLSGLTMLAFLRHTVSEKRTHLIFSTVYALGGYCVANCFQLFWLLSVAMLPLVAWGIHRIVEGKSAALYLAALAYAIFQNYYIGYMLCVFSLLYFLVLFFTTREERQEAVPVISDRSLLLRYGVSSLLGGLLCAVIHLPILLSFVEGRLTQVDYTDFEFVENMPLLQIGAKLFTGANSISEQVNGLPNIFCTLLPVALCLLFFLDDKNAPRKKVGYFVLLLVYLLSFYIRTFSSVFQMFSHTNWFNYRYSFVFTFLLLLIAAEEFEHITDIAPETVKKCLVIMALATVLIFAQRYEFVSGAMALVDWALLLAIFGALSFHKNAPERASYRAFALLVLLCCSLQLYMNYFFTVKKLDDWGNTLSDYTESILAPGAITEGVASVDDSFYRMEIEENLTSVHANNGIMYGYNGVGQITSTERAYILKGLSRFGVNWYDMRSYYTPGVPAAMDSFLGLKYIMSENDLTAEKAYDKKLSVEETSLYQNPFVLPVSILSDSALADIDPEAVNIFQLQNKLWQSLSSGSEDIFTPVADITYTMHALTDPKAYTTDGDKLDNTWNEDAESDTEDKTDSEPNYYISYSFTATSEDPAYIYLGTYVGSNGYNGDALQCLGAHKVGETVTGRVELSANIPMEILQYSCDHFSVYYENLDVLAAHSGVIQARDVSIQKERGNVISGSFTADEARTLLFTIPYDEGWTLYIDGVEAKYEKVLDIFMACPVEAGTHSWRMVYVPVGMKLGGIITAAAALGCIVFAVMESRWLRKRREQESVESAV